MSETPSGNPAPGGMPAGKKTAIFAGGLLVVLAVFIGLSLMEGPPIMPANEVHKPLKKDAECLGCHNWPDQLPAGASVMKPLGKDHPPPRPKKRKPVAQDGAAAAPIPVEFECLKCHAPR